MFLLEDDSMDVLNMQNIYCNTSVWWLMHIKMMSDGSQCQMWMSVHMLQSVLFSVRICVVACHVISVQHFRWVKFVILTAFT